MVNLIKIMLTFVIFDDLFINWVYPPNPIFRFISQLAVYIILLIIIVRFKPFYSIISNNTIKLFIVFLIIVLISSTINGGSLFYKIANINAFLKYTPIIFVLGNRKLSKGHINDIFRYIFFLGMIVIIVNVVQFLFPATISYFLPKQDVIQIGEIIKKFNYKDAVDRDGLVGVFGHSPTDGLFIAIMLGIYLFNIQQTIVSKVLSKKMIKISFVFLLIILISQTFSTISLIMAFILIIIFLSRFTRIFKNPFAYIIVILLFMLFVNSSNIKSVGEIADISKITSVDYFENSLQNSRLWFVTEIPATLIDNAEFFGYGTDMENVKKEISKNNPSTGRKIIAYSAFDDIYWVAILAYYGILGLIVFIVFNYKLITLIMRSYYKRSLKYTYLSILFIVLFGALLVATFEFRVISFFYWFIISISLSTSKSQISTNVHTNS